MIKEIKYIVYLLTISFFIFFVLKYYFSDSYQKKYFSIINSFEDNMNISNLPILKNDTINIIKYTSLVENKNIKKKRNFWNLLQ